MVLSCAARDPDATSSTRAAILDGELDRDDQNVFLLVTHIEGHAGLCTASLIAPNLLLTARHCVSAVSEEQVVCSRTTAGDPYPPSQLFATNAFSQDEVTSAYRVASIDVPPSSLLCGNDVALVTLTSVVPTSVAIPLVPRIDRAVAPGETYRAVGYGLAQPDDDGSAGVRRQRAGLAVECQPGSCGSGTRSNEFVGDSSVCSGDSGGPALDEAGKVVGVVSRSGTDCAHPVYASAAAWKDWLIEVARAAAERGKYDAPFWVESGLSDPPLGGQGDRCTGPEGCGEGFACYSPTLSTTDAYCAADCSEQPQCTSGTHCDPGSQVCIRDPAAEPSSSCAVARPGTARGSASALMLLALATALGTKRKSASRTKRLSCH